MTAIGAACLNHFPEGLIVQALRRIVYALCGIVATACGCINNNPDLTAQNIIVGGDAGGTTNVTTERSEVAIGLNGCTSTLIAPRYAIVAQLCLTNPMNSRQQTGGGFIVPGAVPFPIEQTVGLGTVGGVYDIALSRLTVSVSQSVASPARMATLPVSSGYVTAMGYGCIGNVPPDGNKRFITYYFGTGPDYLCGADIGGPLFQGALPDDGAMFAVARSARPGAYADVTRMRLQIEQTIRDFEGGFEPGLSRPGFDLAGSQEVSASACQIACTQRADCRAFSYVPDTQRCWIKSSRSSIVPDAFSVSGLPLRFGHFNRNGGDYRSFAAASDEACESECMLDPVCQSFVRFAGTCFLKNTIPPPSPCAGCMSGARHAREVNTNYVGGDYASGAAASVADCEQRCAFEPRCLAYSFVASSGTCWLKDRVPTPTAATGVTSAVRGGWELNTSRIGGNLFAFNQTTPNPEQCQSMCESVSTCRAWTLTISPSGTAHTCYIKGSVPASTPGVYGVIAGRRGASFF